MAHRAFGLLLSRSVRPLHSLMRTRPSNLMLSPPLATSTSTSRPLSTPPETSIITNMTSPPASHQPPAPLKYKYFLDDSSMKEEEGVPPMVKAALDLRNADAPERKQAQKQAWIKHLQIRSGDTGSTPVQVACLTVRIQHIKEHVSKNRQDKAARRAYDQLLSQRRKLLQYLRRKDFLAYRNTLRQLDISGFK